MANYPVPYQNNWGYSGVGQQMYPQYQGQGMQQMGMSMGQMQPQHSGVGIKWVDGEVGAKAYQMPQGWPANQPIDLWDTNDTVIYLKSVNPMGMPNPLQKAHYTLEEYRGTGPSTPVSGAAAAEHEVAAMPDMSQYVKKEDLERLRQDMIDTIGTMGTSGTGVSRRSAAAAATKEA